MSPRCGPALAFALSAAAAVWGCSAGGAGGSLTALSLRPEPVVLDARCRSAFYVSDGTVETSFFLSDVGPEALSRGEIDDGVFMHINLLWVPKSGATPMDDSATNVAIHYVVISGDAVGVYGGAGFAIPRGRAGDASLTLTLRNASMTLLESTDGFVDLLSPARLTGTFTASLDEPRARRIQRAVSQRVTDALGRSRLVSRPTPGRRSSGS